MTTKMGYWLYGLEGEKQELLLEGLAIRKMDDAERGRVIGAASNLFLAPPKIWENMTTRFPYVGFMWVEDGFPVGGTSPVELLFSLLSAGEVRSPITWSSKSGCDSMILGELQHRLVNGALQPVLFEDIEEPLQRAWPLLKPYLLDIERQREDKILFDRLFEAKRHGFANPTQLVERSANICMALEYLFNEGSKSEVQFRLGMSIAWLLADDSDDRERILKVLRDVYGLRSKRVHGSRISKKALAKISSAPVRAADNLLRRSIGVKIVAEVDDDRWIQLFKSARVGASAGLDQADWLGT